MSASLFLVVLLTCVTGVSGSGKSTLINRTLYPVAATTLNKATTLVSAAHERIEGMNHLDKVVDIESEPNWSDTRVLTPQRTRDCSHLFGNYSQGFRNRARAVTNPGVLASTSKAVAAKRVRETVSSRVEMHFLPDIYVPCDVCKGARYNRETLDIRYKGKNIHQVLDLTIEEARAFFDAVPMLSRKLQTLVEVGLSYVRLGQSATTLSGGEAQRVKLSRELSKRDTGKTLYILDEPHNRTTLSRYRPVARGAAQVERPWQYRCGHRAQPRCNQNSRLGY